MWLWWITGLRERDGETETERLIRLVSNEDKGTDLRSVSATVSHSLSPQHPASLPTSLSSSLPLPSSLNDHKTFVQNTGWMSSNLVLIRGRDWLIIRKWRYLHIVVVNGLLCRSISTRLPFHTIGNLSGNGSLCSFNFCYDYCHGVWDQFMIMGLNLIRKNKRFWLWF